MLMRKILYNTIYQDLRTGRPVALPTDQQLLLCTTYVLVLSTGYTVYEYTERKKKVRVLLRFAAPTVALRTGI